MFEMFDVYDDDNSHLLSLFVALREYCDVTACVDMNDVIDNVVEKMNSLLDIDPKSSGW